MPRAPGEQRGTKRREDRDRRHLEEDVPARRAARRIALWNAEPGDDRVPAPGAEGGAVQLQQADDDEDPRIHRAPRRDQGQREHRTADSPRDVRDRQDGDAGQSPADHRSGRRPDEPVSARARDVGQGEASEVDEAVSRRNERGKVVEAVVVDAPDDRRDDLAARCDAHDEDRHHADRGWMDREQACEDARSEHAERQLRHGVAATLDPESDHRPRSDHSQRDPRAPRHQPFFAGDSPAVRPTSGASAGRQRRIETTSRVSMRCRRRRSMRSWISRMQSLSVRRPGRPTFRRRDPKHRPRTLSP